MNDKRIYSTLTMAGVTPFVACAILPLAGFGSIGLLGPLADVAAGYGLAIISFLAGIHWATQIYDRQQTGFNLLIASNVVFVGVWLAYVLGTTKVALLAELVGSEELRALLDPLSRCSSRVASARPSRRLSPRGPTQAGQPTSQVHSLTSSRAPSMSSSVRSKRRGDMPTPPGAASHR